MHVAALSIVRGSAPSVRSISAKCSTSSCVEKRSEPVHSSVRIQPIDHRSTGCDHSSPSVTSGGRYCRVHTTEEWCSCDHVAPPKSIRATYVLWAGNREG